MYNLNNFTTWYLLRCFPNFVFILHSSDKKALELVLFHGFLMRSIIYILSIAFSNYLGNYQMKCVCQFINHYFFLGFCISEKSRRFCNVTQNPLLETEGRDRSIFSETIFEVVKNMTVPITVLQVTSMSAFRRDAHVGGWSDNPTVPDCSHWCLPGLPDIWNEIFLSYLLADYGLSAVNGKQCEFIPFLISLLLVVIYTVLSLVCMFQPECKHLRGLMDWS